MIVCQIVFFFAAVRNFPEDSVAIAQLKGINNTADFSDAGWGNWLVRETIPIPEPSTFALFVIGLVGLGVMTRRRRKNAAVPQ